MQIMLLSNTGPGEPRPLPHDNSVAATSPELNRSHGTLAGQRTAVLVVHEQPNTAPNSGRGSR